MKCRNCGQEIENEKFCKYCGEKRENTQTQRPYDKIVNGIPVYDDDVLPPIVKLKFQHENNVALTLGIIGLSLSVIALLFLGLLEFVAFGFSLGGLKVAIRNKRKGFSGNGAFVVSLIGLIISSIVCLIIIIGFVLAISLLIR